MIPVALRIKNFLSYGPETQTINFGPYQLICLSGKNGHGKSALLDAITWALWGQARKVSGTAKPDQGLLHLGQTQMMVSFDFICNGTMYRVKREFMQTYGKPVTHLEFGILEDQGSKWAALSGKTIRGSQEVIENTIRLSYEAFTNSAFLRQGQSHEFSTKSPKERKEILASILGLQEYERVRKRTLEIIKELTVQEQTLAIYHTKLASELQKKPELIVQQETLTHALTSITTQEEAFEKLESDLRTRSIELMNKKQQQQMLFFAIEQQKKQYEEQIKSLQSLRAIWKDIHHQSLLANNHHVLVGQRQKLMHELAIHQQTLQKTLILKEEVLKHRAAMQDAEKFFFQDYTQKTQEYVSHAERLKLSLEHKKKQLTGLTQQKNLKEAESTALRKEVALLQRTIIELEKQKNDKDILTKQFEKRKTFYHQYRSQGAWISNELELLHQKQALSHDENNPSCPLCEQNLSASRKKFLHSKFAAQEKFLTHRLKRLSNIVATLKELLVKQHAELERTHKNEQEINRLQLTIAEKERTVAQLNKELCVIDSESKEIADHVHVQEAEYVTICNVITERQKNQRDNLIKFEPYKQAYDCAEKSTYEISVINYQQNAHEQTASMLALIEKQLHQHETLQIELKKQKDRTEEIVNLCNRLKRIKKEINVLEKQLEIFDRIDHDIQVLEQEYNKLNAIKKTARLEKDQILQQKGSLDQEFQKLIYIEQELAEYKKRADEIARQIYDYQIIAAATSKEGIQALLIEQALPEIEYEANALLSKLTNNQAHIIIDSLRDLKKGGSKETLDIKISDAAGIRPYEMFSGGEAFRIDFALRIAVSKLLARRAGTSLQTLIIDEGFGSQDEEGLSHIMDAMYKIQEDFAKVIIVSHLPSMKENFPVHFCVEKKANGSIVSVVELE